MHHTVLTVFSRPPSQQNSSWPRISQKTVSLFDTNLFCIPRSPKTRLMAKLRPLASFGSLRSRKSSQDLSVSDEISQGGLSGDWLRRRSSHATRSRVDPDGEDMQALKMAAEARSPENNRIVLFGSSATTRTHRNPGHLRDLALSLQIRPHCSRRALGKPIRRERPSLCFSHVTLLHQEKLFSKKEDEVVETMSSIYDCDRDGGVILSLE